MKKTLMLVFSAGVSAALFIFLAPIFSGSSAAIAGFSANPAAFNSITGNVSFDYVLSDITSANVLLKIYDFGKNIIRTIDGGVQGAGSHSIVWDGKDDYGLAAPEGGYDAELEAVFGGGGGGEWQSVLRWGTFGSSEGRFAFPQGIAADAGNNIYVADNGNHRIQKFDSRGNFLLQWGSFGDGQGFLRSPSGIAVDSLNNIYVVCSDMNWHVVQKFDSEGNFILSWGESFWYGGQFNRPTDIAVDAAGNVYVADTFNNRIQKFDSEGNFLSRWGTAGVAAGQFRRPYGVAVDGAGFVYVADTLNNRVQKFDSNGNFLSQFGSYGSGPGNFNAPLDVAVDSSGNIFVSDMGNYRVQKFDSNGNFLMEWGGYGQGIGQFLYPYGLAVDGENSVYVVDRNNHRVEKFAYGGRGGVLTARTNVLVDNTPPEIFVVSPSQDDVYVLNQPLLADWSVTDNLSGVKSAGASVESGRAVDTGSVGQKTFNVDAVDNAGNRASRIINFSVVYNYGGILPPIKPDDTGIYKLGSVLPVKFQLFDANGDYVANAVAKLYLSGAAGEIKAVSAGAAAEENLFRYDSEKNQYIFNLKTSVLSKGTWRLRIELDDGTSKFATIVLN